MKTGVKQIFASVIIDVPAKEIDRPFEYIVPDNMAGQIKVGSIAVVPFAKTTRLGYVASLTEEPVMEHHAEIKGLVDEPPVFDETMAALAAWTAEKYISSVPEVIRLMLPPGRGRRIIRNRAGDSWNYIVSKPKVDIKTEEYAKLAVSGSAANNTAETLRTAPKQKRALLALAEEPLPTHRLLSYFGISRTSLRSLEKKGLVQFYRSKTYREPDFTYPEELPLDLKPTPEQAVAIKRISDGIDKKGGRFLLQGVTGSGKTEVYLRAIAHALEAGQSAIALVPEIALTPQTVGRFRSRFDDRVAVLHSGLGLGERFDQWRRIKSGEYQVVVGARSAVWAPVAKLGLIVVDEEQENSYKQDRTPRYHARDVAIERAGLAGATVVMGSATPSVESRYRADKGEFERLNLTKRIEDRPMPAVEIIDMREAAREGRSGYFSARLLDEISSTVQRGDKVILFLNRRGFANFIICRDCGFVINCRRCNVSLTYHSSDRSMICHHCGHTEPAPGLCPSCSGKNIGFFGAGTERIESEIRELFPDTQVTRMDSDTTTGKDAHRKKLVSFKEGKGGILLGTQMIAKGLDFPDVTLVGIINADTALNLPDFRAGERTFQLMMQVGGRAGRGIRPGRVLVQTYNPDNYAIKALVQGDYGSFYEQEVTLRDALDYPPFCELINVGLSGENEEAVAQLAADFAADIRAAIEDGKLTGVKEVLGPAPAPLSKIKNRWRWHLILKTDGSLAPRRFLRETRHVSTRKDKKNAVAIIYDVDPVSLL